MSWVRAIAPVSEGSNGGIIARHRDHLIVRTGKCSAFLCAFLLLSLVAILPGSTQERRYAVSGRVLDSLTKQPINEVVVQLNRKKADGTKAAAQYTLTDHAGHFSLSFTAHQTDRLILEISRLDYQGYRREVSFPPGEMVLLLRSKVYDLPDVVVKDFAIYSRRDTISYAARAFIAPDTYTLEDLMRRMPGLSIGSDGLISYMGEKIDRLYIEGLDMLGGNYPIATQNIKAEDIASVEVLENHQPVKVLRGLRDTNMASVNVKLKNPNMIRPSGEASVGMGQAQERSYTPYEAKANLLLINARLQTLAVLNANNTSARIDAEGTAQTPSPATGLLSSNPATPPPASLDRYNRGGTSCGATANGINRIGSDYTFRYNLSYANRAKRYSRFGESRYTVGEQEIFTHETESPSLRAQTAGSTFSFNLNDERSYVDNKLQISGMHEQAEVSVGRDGLQFVQEGYARGFSASNKFSYKRRTDSDDLVEFAGAISYAYTPIAKYFVSGASPYAYRQQVSGQALFGSFGWDYSFILSNRSSITATMGVNAQYGTLDSKGDRPYALNDVNGGEVNISVSPTYAYRGEYLHLSLGAPLSLLWAKYHYIQTERTRKNFEETTLYPGAELSVRYQRVSEWFLRGRVGFSRANNGSIVAFLSEPIRQSYSAQRKTSEPSWPATSLYSAAVSFEYKKPMQGFFSAVDLSAGRRVVDHTVSTIVSEQGVETTYTKQRSKLNILNGRTYLAQNIRSINTTFSVELLGGYLSMPFIRQNQKTELDTYTWVFHPYTSSYPLSWLSVNLDARLEGQTIASQDFRHANLSLGIGASVSIVFAKHFTFNVSSSSTFRREKDFSLPTITFFDGSIRYKRNRFAVDLEASNLLDVRSYELIRLVEMDRFYSAYPFRSRALLARLAVKF